MTDSVFQEVDLATGLVRREWHSLDHIALSESYSSPMSVSTACASGGKATVTWPPASDALLIVKISAPERVSS